MRMDGRMDEDGWKDRHGENISVLTGQVGCVCICNFGRWPCDLRPAVEKLQVSLCVRQVISRPVYN